MYVHSGSAKYLEWFLNLDFARLSDDDRKKLEIDLMPSYDIGFAQAVQAEARHDVAFIVDPKYERPVEGLETLIGKLNEWAKYAGPSEKGINPQWRLMKGRAHPEQAGLVLKGKKYFVDSYLVNHDFKDQLYCCLAQCLDNRDIGRLRVCESLQCRRFFFAHHLGQLHCNAKCQKQHDKIAARARVEKSRAAAKKRLQEQSLPFFEKVAKSNISTIREILGGKLAESLDEFLPYAERVRSGVKLARVWVTLPPRFKKQMWKASQREIARAANEGKGYKTG